MDKRTSFLFLESANINHCSCRCFLCKVHFHLRQNNNNKTDSFEMFVKLTVHQPWKFTNTKKGLYVIGFVKLMFCWVQLFLVVQLILCSRVWGKVFLVDSTDQLFQNWLPQLGWNGGKRRVESADLLAKINSTSRRLLSGVIMPRHLKLNAKTKPNRFKRVTF